MDGLLGPCLSHATVAQLSSDAQSSLFLCDATFRVFCFLLSFFKDFIYIFLERRGEHKTEETERQRASREGAEREEERISSRLH